ncbi:MULTISPECIES: response regulator [unclassified Sphingomonas]|uniref:response regulator n=1 Tax=unclassified Sphingomonas TaxID=196159 RepID=UPI00278ADDA6|nr:response regulator [Sphingomonas sp. SORGH_AS_0879]MDQ1231360.1 FixJ family two-component response regulator [Sphingomonas sp. SORGH_AS_0879]
MTKTVLLVEDEFFVALDLQSIIEDGGYEVDGPYVSVEEVLAHLDGDRPQLACAILDVRLRDGEVFPAAERLSQAGVPLIFHSGHADEQALQSRYPGAAVCGKPCSPSLLRRTLSMAVSGPDQDDREAG